jgi:hypothetical protein
MMRGTGNAIRYCVGKSIPVRRIGEEGPPQHEQQNAFQQQRQEQLPPQCRNFERKAVFDLHLSLKGQALKIKTG